MTWQCKQHGKNCKSYVSSDMEELNNAKIKPENLREWYTKNFPCNTKPEIDIVMKYYEKVIEWVEE